MPIDRSLAESIPGPWVGRRRKCLLRSGRPWGRCSRRCSPAAGPSPVEDFDYASAEPIALGALARLPEDRRRLVALAYLEGESRASLSQRFGVPVGTIKTWLHRTILSVRKDCLSASAAA